MRSRKESGGLTQCARPCLWHPSQQLCDV